MYHGYNFAIAIDALKIIFLKKSILGRLLLFCNFSLMDLHGNIYTQSTIRHIGLNLANQKSR